MKIEGIRVLGGDSQKLDLPPGDLADLEDRNQELQDLLDALPSLAWTVGPDRLCTYLNRPWVEYTGLSLDTQLGEGWGQVVHPDDRSKTFEIFSNAFERREEFEVEYRLLGKDGLYRWFLGRGRARYSRSNDFVGYAGTTIDIAERRAQDAKRVRFTMDLEQFNHIAAHDFKEPVRTILAFSAILREGLGEDLPPDAAESLGFLASAAARLNVLVAGFSRLSRTRRAPLEIAAVAMGACIVEAENGLAAQIRETGALIERGVLPVVQADRSLLIQLLQNLIANAIKFRADSAPRIEIGAERCGPDWSVSVRDNGIGIAAKHAAKVFEPFSRLHSAEEYEGAGMGLAFCQTVVERHGGRIWIDPEVPRGACIRFTLPCEPIDQVADEK